MSAPSIEIRNLSKSFGKFRALDQLNLNLEGRKCVGFLGPNGAGKSTTLKLLTDMIFPSAGECFIDGVSVQKERERALAPAGTLVESPEVYPSLTPREALEMVANLRRIPATDHSRRTRAVLEEVRMTEWGDKRIGKFSKGMKQRINLAAALLHDPEVLILDEPTSGLDPRGMVEVRDIVRSLKQQGRLIFMSSHLLQEVGDVCDEVALIDKGRLVLHDSLAAVTAQLATGETTLDVELASAPANDLLTTKISALEGVRSVTPSDPTHLVVRFTGGIEVQERIVEALVLSRLRPLTISHGKGALERVYLERVAKGESP